MLRFFTIVQILTSIGCSLCVHYEASWESLDSRPLPAWYDEAKIGIFVHWGVFSVPSFDSEWFWWRWKGDQQQNVVDFMKKNYKEGFTYQDFAPMFTAEFYNPEEWADLFKDAGAKYVVLVAKHHEGFTNWPSEHSWNWNSRDVGPRRDLTGDLAIAIRNKTNLRFGVYHSLYEWFNPLYLQDQATGYSTQDFITRKTGAELYELVNSYHPDVIWSDGDWWALDEYWNSTNFLAWLYNHSPVKESVVVNDRWGFGTNCVHGGFLTCGDGYNPGKLMSRKWEHCMSLDHSWGYRRTAKIHDYQNITQLLTNVVRTVSYGGNVLINVGPTHDGRIIPVMEERLRQLGTWLKVNGDAMYGSHPWRHQNDTITPNVCYTQNTQKRTVYAVFFDWPPNDGWSETSPLHLGAVSPSRRLTVRLLGDPSNVSWIPHPNVGINVLLPSLTVSQMPCEWAWTLEITGIH